MSPLKEKMIHKIIRLPENRIPEVMDFIDFIASREDRESLEETLNILKDKKLMGALKQAEKDVKAGKIHRWESVRKS